jgi:dienelactone hydrolase
MRGQPAAWVTIFSCVMLNACGSGGDNTPSAPAPTAPATPQRGTLVESPPSKLQSYSTADLIALLGGNDVGQALVQLALTPKCAIDVYQIRYQTVGAQAESATASGALMVPTGSDANCQGPRPIVVYTHGTSTSRAYNIADLANADNKEGVAVAAAFAAQGYIVVAPNYVGYDSSSLSYHPYLNADQQSKDTIDTLTAARSALPTASAPTVTDNGKVFITGYSEGGYVAMATHRAMQTAGTTVTASAPMSGPYALAAFGDAVFRGNVSAGAPVNLTLLINGYQKAYGNIYSATTDVFEARYATGIDSLLPSATSQGDLEAAGRLPSSSVFSTTPPDPAFASLTPPTPATPPEFAALFAKGFGTDNLITNGYRLAYLNDAETAPDGGFPTQTDGLPPANPANNLRKALETNDLRTWTPNVPVLLCGGNLDPTVFFFNTQLMQAFWTTNVPAGAVTILDVDSASVSDDPYADLKNGFSAAKDLVRANAVVGGASDGGDMAVLDAYHAGLVPPFCLSAVKRFFDAH